MATVDNLVQMMNTLPGPQQHALNQEISRLTAENQQFRQAGSQDWRRLPLLWDKQFGQRFPMRIHDRMHVRLQSTSKVLENLQRSRKNLRNSPTGSGRPWFRLLRMAQLSSQCLSGWKIKTTSSRTKHLIDSSVRLGAEPVGDVLEKSEQVHVALLALTESCDIVLGAVPSGLESLRRLVRRWDPLSGGKRGARLRQILVPDRCNLQDLSRRTQEVEGTGSPTRKEQIERNDNSSS